MREKPPASGADTETDSQEVRDMIHIRVLFALLLVLVFGAVWTASSDEMPQIDPHRTLGPPVQVDNLTVWPVLTDAPRATGELLSLHQAQSRGLATVREKGAAESGHRRGGATVNELVIENRSDRPVLVTAGTILKGGKQDRQLGQDLVVAAGTTVPVDAFCVEHGRWTEEREGRPTDGIFEVPAVKASKRLRAAAHYDKDQAKVWRQVDTVNRKADNAPSTATFLATAEEDDGQAQLLRQRLETAVRQHFDHLDGEAVVGFAYAVNGEPLGMRAFANRGLLESNLEPFVKTMSLEAQVAQFRDRIAGRQIFDRPASSEPLLKIVRGVAAAEPEDRSTSGLNRNRYRRNDWGGHSSCLIESGGRWVPVTEDWTAPVEASGEVREQLERLQALGYTDY